MCYTRPFTLIDFYESLSTIDAVKVDFDNSYPHQTAKLMAWIQQWLPRVLVRQGMNNESHYQAIAVETGLILAKRRVNEMALHLSLSVDRKEVLMAIAMVINLSQCVTFRAVRDILFHFFREEWAISCSGLSMGQFNDAQYQFYHTLQEASQ